MSEYGLEFYRADGSTALSVRETLPRLVHVERVNGNFSGTFSVPDFDAVESGGLFTGSGFFYVQKVPFIAGSSSFEVPIARTLILPTLDWNNTTKVMSVSPASIQSGWPPGSVRSPYEIVFMHFR